MKKKSTFFLIFKGTSTRNRLLFQNKNRLNLIKTFLDNFYTVVKIIQLKISFILA